MCLFVFIISLLLLAFELWEEAAFLWPYPASQGAQMEATYFTDKQIGTMEGFPWRVGLLSFCLYLRKVLLWRILQIHKKFLLYYTLGFPGVSDCKESACKKKKKKNLPAMQVTRIRSLGQEYSLEKEKAIHSSILAWRILWTEEPGKL